MINGFFWLVLLSTSSLLAVFFFRWQKESSQQEAALARLQAALVQNRQEVLESAGMGQAGPKSQGIAFYTLDQQNGQGQPSTKDAQTELCFAWALDARTKQPAATVRSDCA